MVENNGSRKGTDPLKLLPEQCRAARGLVYVTQERLAELAGVSRSTIRDFESHRHALHKSTEAQLIRALEELGVRLLPSGREGPGVRLDASRPDR